MKLIPYTRTIEGDTETPITLYRKYAGDDCGILLESCEQPKGRYSFIAANPVAVIRSKGESIVIEERGRMKVIRGKALDAARDFMKGYRVENTTGIPFVGGLVGTVGYDVIRQHEKLPDTNPDDLGLPDAHLMAVTELIAYDHFYHRVILIVLENGDEAGKVRADRKLSAMEKAIQKPCTFPDERDEPDEGMPEPDCNMSREEYMDKVKAAKRYIHEGDIFQVVISQRWTLKTRRHPFTLYRRLRQVNPSAYMFYFNYGDYQVAGSSPEMLVEVRGSRVRNCPIAGTRPRGADAKEDERLARELLADEKERAEHVMLVDLGRNDMGRIARIGSVKVTEFMNVKHYSHVMHLASQVKGEKREDRDVFQVLASFLPAGTLSGAPKIRAMEIIEELEPEKRGIYGGAAGYLGFDGDMDMCIAIRTMVLYDGCVYLQAGAGIVADSVPEIEYEETRSKIRALVNAVEGVERR
jgi:anthranilate synthase component 1